MRVVVWGINYAPEITGIAPHNVALCEYLQSNGVDVEDPGNEIGPTGPDSPHMGLWFHDVDGYRWELSVENAAKA